jgi:hypothetical protein
MRILDATILEQAPPVRLALLEVLHYMMHVDGVMDAREEYVLDNLCVRLGMQELRQLLPEVPEWKRSWAEILQPIGRLVLMEAAIMSVADGVVHRSERVSLEKLALALDEDLGVLERVLAWAAEGQQWSSRGVALMQEGT